MSDRGYSPDLRKRVVAALARGMTQVEAAELFEVGPATVYRWLRVQRETGSVEPRPHGGGHPRALSADDDRYLLKLVEEKPDRTYAELTELLVSHTRREMHASSVVRAVKRLGLTLKKSASRRSSANGRTSSRAGPRS